MDSLNSLPPVIVTPLRRIEHPKGDIYHAMKASDTGFIGFGEAYFTTIIAGETKGWKKHTAMWMNLVVPLGEVKFHVHDETSGQTTVYTVGRSNYTRLTVPPGYWIAFRGNTPGTNLVLNLASLEHDPDEAVNVPLETFALGAGQ
jgi:dTDP-4-dehydrorhamnose 3,5-epimerase